MVTRILTFFRPRSRKKDFLWLAGGEIASQPQDTDFVKTVRLLDLTGPRISSVPLQDRSSTLIHFFIGYREWFFPFKKRQGNASPHDYNPVPSVGLGFIKTEVCPSDQRFG